MREDLAVVVPAQEPVARGVEPLELVCAPVAAELHTAVTLRNCDER